MNDVFYRLRQSSNVPERCYNTAVMSKKIFLDIMAQHYPDMPIIESTPETDYKDHIDFTFQKSGKQISVDIKSAKKFFENPNIVIENEDVWIELKNVNGENGWLYGKADFLIYVFLNELWVVGLEKLRNYLEGRINKVLVENKNDATYKYYQRNGRKDLLTKMPLADIKSMVVKTLRRKNGN